MKQKRFLRMGALVLLAAVLMGTGLYSVIRVYRHYRSDMLTYESRHLNSIVSASARGMDWMMGGYSEQLSQLLMRREIIRAEEEYAETKNVAVWRELMTLLQMPDQPGSLQLRLEYSVAVFESNGALLATTYNGFPSAWGGEEELGDGLWVRADRKGEFWFVFRQMSDTGLWFELALPVRTAFSYHADAARVGRGGYLFLLDREGRFLSASGNGVTEIYSAEELLAAEPAVEAEALAELANGSGGTPEEYSVYRFPWTTDEGRSVEETLVVTCPLTTGGGSLIMGAAMSFQEFDSFLSGTLREVTWIILLMLSGALILFFVAARAFVDNRRDRLELQAVRERADLMEEINRQQQSLQHTERLQQLGVMTSGVVHEFNNMLTPIMSQSMLLLEELADQENSPEFESALDIYEASENAREMLRRMSALGKGDMDMGFRALEMGGLLKKIMNLSALAKDPHIQQEIILPAEPLYVEGNEQLLTQAFLNLCINACQAMGEEGTLTITAEREDRSGHAYARVEVKDTGPGISEEKFDFIYDPYFTTKGEGGTGLGLAICRKIIETHKGTIAVANRETGGAVFTVRIPVCEPEEEE